ncbi:hypothetical protein [Halomonas urumqiensis]|uniref:Sulfotransferase family protein n=1 Tax=Halomonas urumqiensis TaxID=1684789 RepID=A0A2N7UCI6_9GAMM|nr:hypothetical protein [Halomonas urumqiensis]PMR78144.1 hypothetical protein C1H70_15320 [Halomonas urumqiensis]PTB03293.1 hypothetical protein C6V82_01955 [Halomonas urumqiensis]GHE20546.1 hypothetical protein GCM10017767_10670 [Halomonas urumqiensis]
MKRKLIIHVGMGKTGSSSIQKTLRMARPQLKEAGILYLGLMLEHTKLSGNLSWHQVSGWRDYLKEHAKGSDIANRQLSDAFAELDAYLPESIHTLVWSNESLFDSIQLVRPALQAISQHMDIQVVGYIRRPDTWITSAYLQWGIKHKTYKGPLKSFSVWSKDMPYVVYSKASSWHALVENSWFANFDAIPDVSEHFLKSLWPDIAPGIPMQRENDTPSPAAMALFALHNSLSVGQVLPSEIEPLLIKAGLVGEMQKSHPYNQLLPEQADVITYVENNWEEVERINALMKEMGQPEFDVSTPRFKDYSTSQLDINRAMMELIVSLAREVDRLKSRLDAQESRND